MVKGLKNNQGGTVGDLGDQMRGQGAFVPVLASAGVGPQGLLDGADKDWPPLRIC